MRIGELARVTGTQVETIRFYEREGLLPAPARSSGNYRIYGAHHADRLSFIRNCRGLDVALDEIRVLLRLKDAPAENCHRVNELLDEHIGHVAQRLRELRQLQRQLERLRELCTRARDAAHCGILAGLSGATVARRGSGRRQAVDHVGGTHRGGRRRFRPLRLVRDGRGAARS